MTMIEELAPERRAIYREIERKYGPEELEKLLDMLEALIKSQE